MCHLDGFESLGYGTDLVQLDQNGVCTAKADSFCQTFGVGYKQVIANQLYRTSKFFGHHLPSFPVFLIQTVFDGVDRVFAAQFFPVCYQFFGCKFLSAFWQNVFALLVAFPLAGCSIHSQYKVFARFISCSPNCFQYTLDGFFIAAKIRCESTLVTYGSGQTFLF